MPDEGGSLTKALMSAVLLRARQDRQSSFDFSPQEVPEAEAIGITWTNASEKEKKARTIFAQHSLKPEEVAGPDAFALLESPGDDVPEPIKTAPLATVKSQLATWTALLNAYASERAAALAADHSRVRQALGSRSRVGVRVEAVTPVDIIGAYILLPKL